MAKDFLGGFGNLGGALGGLVSGLAKSGLAPKDDPAVKLINAQSEVSDLQKQEEEILCEIGKAAFAQNPSAWPQASKLQLVRTNLVAAEENVATLKREQEAAQQAQEQEDAMNRCPSCGCKNSEDIKFCQECGTKLGASSCTSCGAELQPGIRFCGECGTKQED
jgi:Predicted membrane protein